MNPEFAPDRKPLAAAWDGAGPGFRALFFMVLTAGLLFPACTQPAPVETREDGRLPIFHRTGTPIYFTDLSRAQPESALTRQEKRFAWRLIDYETEDFQGTLLFAGEEARAPDLTLGLDTPGVHDVYVGMFNTAWRPYQNMTVRARLSGDPAFSTLFLPAPEGLTSGVPEDDTVRGPRIQEVYFKTADLSGQDLIIRQPCQRVVPPEQEYGNRCEKAWIAYVKLVPLNPEEVATLEQDRERTDTRRLFGYNDSWAVAWGRAGAGLGRVRPLPPGALPQQRLPADLLGRDPRGRLQLLHPNRTDVDPGTRSPGGFRQDGGPAAGGVLDRVRGEGDRPPPGGGRGRPRDGSRDPRQLPAGLGVPSIGRRPGRPSTGEASGTGIPSGGPCIGTARPGPPCRWPFPEFGTPC